MKTDKREAVQNMENDIVTADSFKIQDLLHKEDWLTIWCAATVMFSNIKKFGLYGLGIAWFVTPIVIIFMWIFGTKVLKMRNKRMVITIAAATSVCGTSAAIATAAACKAKKTDLTFAVGMSLIFTVAMMVGIPFFCEWCMQHNVLGMTELIGGSWIGGTVDSTGAVVLAGSALGDVAGQAAALVKMIQNILIGFVAFAVAIFFATKVDKTDDKTVGAEACADIQGCFKQLQTWCFALALYVIGQTFNLILTYFICWLLLSGVMFPIPTLLS